MRHIKIFLKRYVFKALSIISRPLKGTTWYLSKFVDCERAIYPTRKWHLSHDDRNFDLVVVGSSSAKWSFDFNGLDIKALNWGQQPQYLQNDFRIIKNYHSILRKGGQIVMTISPLSALYFEDNLRETLRYIHVLDHSLLNSKFITKAKQLSSYPVLFGLGAVKLSCKETLKKLIRRKSIPVHRVRPCDLSSNPMNVEELNRDALSWINCWKEEFQIENFEDCLSEINHRRMATQIKLLQDMIDFCSTRGYKVSLVIPPVTKYLGRYFTDKFRKVYIDDFLEAVDRHIDVLDYMCSDEFSDPDLYFNSFWLNKKGRCLFTERVLADMNRIGCGY